MPSLSLRTRRHLAALALAAAPVAAGPRALAAQSRAAQPARAPVQVLRVTPADSAGPGAVVTVVFDRPPPAASRAGAPIPAATLAPTRGVPVAVRSEWADPVTLHLVPLAPLAPRTVYVVTLARGLTAGESGRPAGPARYTFAVRPPRLTASDPQLSPTSETALPPNGRVRLLFDAPLDSHALARSARLTFRSPPRSPSRSSAADSCTGRPPVIYAATVQRAVRTDDPYQFEGYRAMPAFALRDSLRPDRFRRVVEFTPTTPVPEGCAAVLTVLADPSTDDPSTDDPSTDDPSAADAVPVRYAVRTAPPFALAELRHTDGVDSTIVVAFTAPVRASELMTHLHLVPARPFTIANVYPNAAANAARTAWPLRTAVPLHTTVRVVVDSTLRDDSGRRIDARARTAVLAIPGRLPRVGYDLGLVTADLARHGPALPLLRVRHVNVARAEVVAWIVPDSLLPRVLGRPSVDAKGLASLGVTDSVQTVVVLPTPRDSERVTPIPLPAALATHHSGTLWAVRVRMLEPAAGVWADDSTQLSAVDKWRVQMDRRVSEPPPDQQPLALLQGGDLAVQAKGAGDGVAAFVTRRSDGQPVAGVYLTLLDTTGAVRAHGTTAADGLVTLAASPAAASALRREPHPYQYAPPTPSVVTASFGDAHIAQPLYRGIEWRPDDRELAPYELGARGGDGARSRGVLYTDRAYYRPGETVHLAAIARDGLLGALHPPALGDSVRLVVHRAGMMGGDSDSTAVRDTLIRPDAFGTFVDSLRIAPTAPLDAYVATVALWRDHAWQVFATALYRVAEYRAPEFLVGVALDSVPRLLGDTVNAHIDARLLFDAPMPDATLRWRSTLTQSGGVTLPGLGEGWTIGDRGWSGFDGSAQTPAPSEQHSGTLTLDRAPARLLIPTTRGLLTRPGTLRLDAAVTDLNRQTVTHSAAITIHPARVYLAARDSADAWTWRAGVPQAIRLFAQRPDGHRTGNVRVRVSVVAARWEQEPGNIYQGHWMADTLARDSAVIPAVTGPGAPGDTSAATTLHIVSPRAGAVAVVLRAVDEDGRSATTVLTGWAIGAGEPAPWWQRTQPVRLALLATRSHLTPGDTAELHYRSPFADATAWITVERERVLRSWTVPVRQGTQIVRVPVSAADAPNVYLGVTLVPRGATAAAPTGLDTASIPLEQRIRAGYALLDIAPDSQRIALTIAPQRRTYAPGDTAHVTVHTTGARGRGIPASVTLWAVDEGVLALGDYARPDPLARLYAPEGLGWMLGSTLTRLGVPLPPWANWRSRVLGVSAMPLNEAVRSERRVRRTGMQQSEDDASAMQYDRPLPAPPPGAGSAQLAPVLPRHDFRSTAFFLGGVRTDANGVAEARPVLPDNLTTFRVVAVAASAGDAYAGADTTLVATKPFTVRAALPRFVRVGDSLDAGAIVTWRDTTGGRTRAGMRLLVHLRADAFGGLVLHAAPERDTTLAPGGSAEIRWPWRVPADGVAAAQVQFTGRTTAGSDAVRTTIPVRPSYLPHTYAFTGTLASRVGGIDTVRLAIPAGLDPMRSEVQISAGPTPAPAVRAAVAQLLTYPYDCTEQLTSRGRALVALLQLHPDERGSLDATVAPAELGTVIVALSRRQRADGAFGYWSDESWSTAWLSAEVGRLLLDARVVGAQVPGEMLDRVRRFLADSAKPPLPPRDSLSGTPAERRAQAARALAGRLAALAYLRRVGAPDSAAERRLIGRAAELAWEDRASLVMLLAARGDSAHADALLDTLWRGVGRVGARAELADSLLRTAVDFPSRVRPAARLLLATRALRPAHPRLGELAAQLQQRAASERGRLWWAWNTQDLAAAAEGLATVAGLGGEGAASPSAVRFTSATGTSLPDTGTPMPLASLLTRARGRAGGDVMTLRVTRAAGAGPVFYALTVHAVPLATESRARAAREDSGLTVERWVEPLDASVDHATDGAAGARPPRVIGDMTAGALVRVYLRVTAPADREFVALEDPLPAGLEAVDLSLRTSGTLAPFVRGSRVDAEQRHGTGWLGSPWEHTEQRDAAVRWYARRLARGTYTVSYVARATTPGRFVRIPAHAEEMYNAALAGRTDGGMISVRDGAAPGGR